MLLMSYLTCLQPLVRRQQDALSIQLRKQLERVNLGLKETVCSLLTNNRSSLYLFEYLVIKNMQK